MNQDIYVIKQNGNKELLDISKIQKQVQVACKGIEDVSPSMIEVRAQLEFYDGISTKTIDETLLKAMVNLIDESEDPEINNVNYQYVAGRQRNKILRKHVYGQFKPPHLYDIVKKNIDNFIYTEDLLKWYTKDEWNILNSHLDHSYDENLEYAAIEQYVDKYLARNRVTKQVYETPSVCHMVIAATAFHMETENRIEKILNFYTQSINRRFTLSTPVISGVRSRTKQFSSCTLVDVGDSIESIFNSGKAIAKYAAKRAGIGINIGRIRPIGSPIRKGEIVHTGLTGFLKKLFYDMKSVSQGGVRGSSATANIQFWHPEIQTVLVLKNNQGTEETRVRHFDYCITTSALLYKRYKEDKEISLFDPSEVPELYDAFYQDIDTFNILYEQYESRTDIKVTKVFAKDVVELFFTERHSTGRIFELKIDNVQRQGPFNPKKLPVVMTNLCTEIMLPTYPMEHEDDRLGRIALCTLGSINWGSFKHPSEMRDTCHSVVRFLCNLLGYQDFLTIQSSLSNSDIRPLGIGVTNLAFWHAQRGYQYGDQDALNEIAVWMEHQAYYLIEASVQLAEERGACDMSHETCYGQGIFPWEKRAKGVNELIDFKTTLEWEPLRTRMIKSGVHCGCLIAIAPVESSSVVINSTNGINIPKSLITVKDSKSGVLVQVVPGYKEYKQNYPLLWEQKSCEGYVKTAAVLGIHVDQGISIDTFWNPANYESKMTPLQDVADIHMKGHHWGVKSFYYAITNKLASKEDESTNTYFIDEENSDDDFCEACVL